MFKKFILAGVSLFLIVYAFISSYRTPLPIIDNISDSDVVMIRYNDGFEQGNYIENEITEFNEKEILRCISKYDEQRTLNKLYYGALGRSLNDFEIIVAVHADKNTDNDLKFIYLGKDSYLGSGDDIKHIIINDSDLNDELKELILK